MRQSDIYIEAPVHSDDVWMVQCYVCLPFSKDFVLLVVFHNLHLRNGLDSVVLATSFLLA